MKKSLTKALAVVCAMTLSLGMFGCSKKEDAGTTTKANEENKTTVAVAAEYKLLKDGVLTVGAEVGYPPFEMYADDGKTPIGFDMDMINEIGKRLGLEVKIIDTAYDGIFAGLDVNYDCVCSGVTINEDRKKTMLFTTPYIQNYQAVAVKADSNIEVKGFKDLDKLSIAFQKGTTTDELITDLVSTGTINCSTISNEKITACFTQLSNGEVDAVVGDSTVLADILAKNEGKYKIIFTDTEEPEEFGIAISMSNEKLRDAFNKCLADMEKDGFMKDTYDYWFGAEK